MKKLLNTLYVTTEGAGLRKDGENLIAEVDGAERARVPLHVLGSVVVFGAIYVSPPLIQACAGAGITIVLLDRAGRFQARTEGPVSGNVLLRREQYRVSDAPDDIVRSIVSGRIANQRTVLQRALRDHGLEIVEVRGRLEAQLESEAQCWFSSPTTAGHPRAEAQGGCAVSPKLAAISANRCNIRCSRSKSIRRSGRC